MGNTWFISDTHFGQDSILRFKRKDGTPLREFDSIEEHDEYIIDQCNKVIKPQDKLYHLGDVCMAKKHIKTVQKINGRKTLIAGNHDIYNSSEYLKCGFDNMRSCKIYPKHKLIFSHYPVHPIQLEFKFRYNVHGHMHSNHIENDNRYINISVENTNFGPISFEEILKKIEIIENNSLLL